MSAPRRFIEAGRLEAGRRRVRLPRDRARYLRSVLRLGAGAPPTLFDGRGREYAAVLAGLEPRGATADSVREAAARVAGNGVVLALALTKGSKRDLVVEKATELGASAVHPVATRRAVPRADERATRGEAGVRSLREALRGAGRARCPGVRDRTMKAAPTGCKSEPPLRRGDRAGSPPHP